jgi:beta-phosphoglucomutase family hydrolase
MMYPVVYPNVKGLIFDLDGTLADSIPTHIHCWDIACSSFGYSFKEEMLIEMTGMPTRVFAEYIKKDSGCRLSVEEIMKLKQERFYQLAHAIKPIEIMAEFAKKQYGKIPMSIGTGGSKTSAGLIMQAIGLKPYFNVIVTADDVVNHKPKPDTFLKCAELMGVEPSFCQVFEDGNPGIAAAREAGMFVTDVRTLF